jgi:hypothetical protein
MLGKLLGEVLCEHKEHPNLQSVEARSEAWLPPR